ncbi:hypothetical protein KQX54_005507 [Cotesia glomerata]|uniref:Uncharacterized protein n=1 Tax=Cotesia glomerata TaxID=32391 RepID=A0AAV7IUY8_COTGL|nr:hypothetical protein KQX54_005507 [Cotesia glomerata]
MSALGFFPIEGAFHRALIFMFKLAWKSRFRLPVLMIAAFVVMDIRMQLEIDVHISCREALNPDEDIGFPPITDMSESLREKLIESHTQVPCIIEYQITKRKIGECAKLTGSIRGCVSDSLVNPFHPDCL